MGLEGNIRIAHLNLLLKYRNRHGLNKTRDDILALVAHRKVAPQL